ncbi:MAG: hypothetical protein EOP84_22175 [Verrucomicrobiaceae bacterium]|nr:MAG: hypothetical protein EOP84_22175 [Verrucomicrobiaceae bacterium]
MREYWLWQSSLLVASGFWVCCLLQSRFPKAGGHFQPLSPSNSPFSYEITGWSQQHYLLAGHWVGMLGAGSEDFASQCWECLKQMKLPEGWQPESIFDPLLEEALKHGSEGNWARRPQ